MIPGSALRLHKPMLSTSLYFLDSIDFFCVFFFFFFTWKESYDINLKSIKLYEYVVSRSVLVIVIHGVLIQLPLYIKVSGFIFSFQ
jgi:hypothetical protein